MIIVGMLRKVEGRRGKQQGERLATCILRAPSGIFRGTWMTVGSFLGGMGGGGGAASTTASSGISNSCASAFGASPGKQCN